MSSVILDLSRLISRVRHSTPSGIDRVEMAYARGLLRLYGDELAFAAVHPTGRYGRLERTVILDYLAELEHRWRSSAGDHRQRSVVSVLPWMARLLPRASHRSGSAEPVYLQVSPHHLTRSSLVRRILQQERARFLCMVHDLIPIEYPEYARPNGPALHRRRMETVARFADAVIVNSAATGRSVQPWIDRSGRKIASYVALLGTEPLPPARDLPSAGERPWFVCIGTIEGRKNHLLLLNLWRQMAETMPTAEVPRLVLIGRRGWENEQVLDMLDRCPALVGHVEEVAGCSDQRLASLLRGARGLLMPSFAEGFGLPVAEALSVGIPVICSDIPAHREVGGDVPDYIDPVDGLGLKALVLDFARQGPRWQAQIIRFAQWQQPTWDRHMAIVADAISALRKKS